MNLQAHRSLLPSNIPPSKWKVQSDLYAEVSYYDCHLKLKVLLEIAQVSLQQSGTFYDYETSIIFTELSRSLLSMLYLGFYKRGRMQSMYTWHSGTKHFVTGVGKISQLAE